MVRGLTVTYNPVDRLPIDHPPPFHLLHVCNVVIVHYLIMNLHNLEIFYFRSRAPQPRRSLGF